MNGVLVVLPWLIAAAFVVLCPLALAIWSGHPDYDPSWHPDYDPEKED